MWLKKFNSLQINNSHVLSNWWEKLAFLFFWFSHLEVNIFFEMMSMVNTSYILCNAMKTSQGSHGNKTIVALIFQLVD